MTVINKRITINAPVDAIMAVLDDPHILPEWFAGIHGIEPTAGFPLEIGSQAKMTYRAGGVSMDSMLTIVANERGSLRQFSMDGMLQGMNSWRLTPNGTTTDVELTIDYKMTGGGLGRIMDKLFVERMNDSNAATSLSNLKARVEG